jgi:mono/diheme cytochrome c family protein
VNTAGKSEAELEQIGTGSYIVNALVDCNGCHQNVAPAAEGGAPTVNFLGGGTEFDLPPPGSGGAGIVYARNLTPDPNTGLKLSEDEFVEVMRTGKDFKNSPDSGTAESLVVMPWLYFRWMSTEDLKAIYAYLKAIPAVQNAVSNDSKGGYAGIPPTPYSASSQTYTDIASGPALPDESAPDPNNVKRGMAITPVAMKAPITSVEDQVRFARGSYIVNSSSHCNDCHTNPARDVANNQITTGSFLTGGTVFNVPPPLQNIPPKARRSAAANLTGANNGFFKTATFTDFLKTITEGTDPNGMALAFPMPWDAFRNMTLEDLESVYVYMTNITPTSGASDKPSIMHAVACGSDGDCDTGSGESCQTVLTGTAGEGKECVGMLACTLNGTDCPVCQTCVQGDGGPRHCAPPDSTSVCIQTAE